MRCRTIAGRSLLDYAVDFDAGVGAHSRAGCAADAGFGLFHVGEMVSSVVNLLLLEREGVSRASDNAEVASLAALHIDRYSSIDFWHGTSFE